MITHQRITHDNQPAFPCWLWNSGGLYEQWEHYITPPALLHPGFSFWHPDQPNPPAVSNDEIRKHGEATQPMPFSTPKQITEIRDRARSHAVNGIIDPSKIPVTDFVAWYGWIKDPGTSQSQRIRASALSDALVAFAAWALADNVA